MTGFQLHQKHEQAVSLLTSSNQDKSSTIKFIKNSIIGNRTNKQLYISLGIVQQLVILLSDADSHLATEIVIVLCSLAHGVEAHVDEMTRQGALDPLFHCLSKDSEPLVDAAAKAIRAVSQYPAVFQKYGDWISILGLRISNGSTKIKSTCAFVLAKLAQISTEIQTLIIKAGVIGPLIALLEDDYINGKESAMYALSCICYNQYQVVSELSLMKRSNGSGDILTLIVSFLRNTNSFLKLQACSCLVYMYRSGGLSSDFCPFITFNVFPTLLKLFSNNSSHHLDSTIQEKAVRIFSCLVSEDEAFQKIAMDSDSILQLAEILNSGPTVPDDNSLSAMDFVGRQPGWEKTEESVLLAIAAVTSLREENRRQALDAKILPRIRLALDSPHRGVRAAACQATRSLSRSVKNLRTSLVDSGIALPLVKLLNDTDLSVQIASTATLCNIVLDFSPMKRIIIENGGIEILVNLVVSSDDTTIRLNALWALKNVLFEADSEIKQRVLTLMGFDVLKRLCQDSSFVIQEQALNILRNSACGKEEDIEFVIQGLSAAKFADILEQKLCLVGIPDEIHLHALYILVNISTGSESHKSLVMNSQTLLSNICRLLSHSKSQMRVAALWAIINLTWPDDLGSASRREKLQQFDFPAILSRQLDSEVNIDVQERLKTALLNFNQGEETQDTMVIDSGNRRTVAGGGTNAEPLFFGSVYDDDNGDFISL